MLDFRNTGVVGSISGGTSGSREWYEDDTKLYNPNGTNAGSIVQLQESVAEETTQLINPSGTIIETTEDLQ
jgi:hypothetical protein